MRRRDFLTTAGIGTLGMASGPGLSAAQPGTPEPPATGAGDREYWVRVLTRIAEPVLTNLAAGTLRARMPVEQAAGADRAGVTHLEAFGRLVAGIAPWIELGPDETPEGRLRGRYAELTRAALARAVDPASPDALNFATAGQPLVDAAFLAQGLLRAPSQLMRTLDAKVKAQLVAALESARVTLPGFSNWLLFAAMTEAALHALGATWDRMRVDYAVRQHDQWYKGDGAYGDGPAFHWDYYNSFVIHPMLVDVLAQLGDETPGWQRMRPRVDARAARYAAVLERMISPEGTFPPIGRSLAYRFGAFHALAQSALRRALPEGVTPSQVRGALTSIIRRGIEAPGTFDDSGWLRLGFCGHQPGVGESYISTGSLYLCAVGLLPLGLPSSDEFWQAAPAPWTSMRAWSGAAFPIDHAIEG
jgi:hypothetical protein